MQRRYGSIDDLEVRDDVPAPVPREGEVLVRVRAASLHPDVWHVVAGRPRILRLMGGGVLRPSEPIPGTDVAGIVEVIGAGVTRFRPGDAVFGETRMREGWIHGAAFAELVAVPEALLARKPERVSFEEAACIPTPGTIALQNLRDRERTGPGREVLVNGAGGGVGTIALQIAKARGARVTAVDAAEKRDVLRKLGADETIDFRREDFTTRVARYDLVFDVPGSRPWPEVRRAMKPDGRYVLIGHDHFGTVGRATFGLIPHFVGLVVRSGFEQRLRGFGGPRPSKPEAIAELARMLEARTLTPAIDSVHPIEDVKRAFHRMMREEPKGRVLLRVADNP